MIALMTFAMCGTKHNKTKQNETKRNKTKQNETKRNKTDTGGGDESSRKLRRLSKSDN